MANIELSDMKLLTADGKEISIGAVQIDVPFSIEIKDDWRLVPVSGTFEFDSFNMSKDFRKALGIIDCRSVHYSPLARRKNWRRV